MRAAPWLTFGVVAPNKGWYPDPSGRFKERWWDGTRWTSSVVSESADSGGLQDDPPRDRGASWEPPGYSVDYVGEHQAPRWWDAMWESPKPPSQSPAPFAGGFRRGCGWTILLAVAGVVVAFVGVAVGTSEGMANYMDEDGGDSIAGTVLLISGIVMVVAAIVLGVWLLWSSGNDRSRRSPGG